MRSLLIYNDNTPFCFSEAFQNEIGEAYYFQIGKNEILNENFTVDRKINDILLSEITIEKYDAIFLPFSLSEENYIEFLGLRFGFHIRLTKEFENIQTPIVFYGYDEVWEVNKLSRLGQILFTQNVFTTKDISINGFKKQIDYLKRVQKSIPDEDFIKNFTSRVDINPPSNYSSHHSIANEWALVRYTSMFNVDDNNNKYKRLIEKIKKLDYLTTLHYKYTEAESDRQRFKQKHLNTPKLNNVKDITYGIIDDEINKGWGEFYDFWLSNSGANSKFYDDFENNISKDNLINKIKHWIDSVVIAEKPIDVFIVDLRLHDDDFQVTKSDNFSGLKIIKYIKKQNPGIQIVVFTASNKVWNFQECLKSGVTGFAIKESPEYLHTRNETVYSLNHFSNEIEKATKKSFLANIFRKIDFIKKNNIFISDESKTEFKELVFNENGFLDQIINLLIIDSDNETIINQCLLLCFHILENYCKCVGSFDFEDNNKQRLFKGYVWLKDNNRKDTYMELPNKKTSTSLNFLFGKFPFQTESSRDTTLSFEVSDKAEIKVSDNIGNDFRHIISVVSVLHFRDNISKKDIDRVIELRYLRSNLAAHKTGNIKKGKTVLLDDIIFFISLFEKIFK